MTEPPFARIPYDDGACCDYGSDKPDLRNPLRITDVTEQFAGSGFGLFAKIAASGGVVRAIPAPGAGPKPRGFFDKLNEWARRAGAGGLGYIQFEADGPKGPIAKNLEPARAEAIRAACGLKPGDAVFFAAGKPRRGGQVRRHGAHPARRGARPDRAGRVPLLLDHRLPDVRAERGDRPHRLQPQPVQHAAGRAGGAEHEDPLTIKAFQYDIVCNGVELSSGAIRNHRPEIMIRAFEIAGYPEARWKRGSAAC